MLCQITSNSLNFVKLSFHLSKMYFCSPILSKVYSTHSIASDSSNFSETTPPRQIGTVSRTANSVAGHLQNHGINPTPCFQEIWSMTTDEIEKY